MLSNGRGEFAEVRFHNYLSNPTRQIDYITLFNRGKKRAYDETRASSSSMSPLPLGPSKTKKGSRLPTSRSSRLLKSVITAKRAETRKCPVCEEVIPLRLLGTHAELESERLEEIIKQVGLTDVLFEDPDDWWVSILSPTTNI